MSVRWPRVLTPTHLSQIIKNQKNPLMALQIFNEVKEKYPSYRHNGPVYATMIGILGRSGRIPQMKEVIEQMKDDSCECRDSVFASAIQTFVRVGKLDEAVSLFNDLPLFNCVNWTLSFNTLLGEMVRESKFEAACRLFLEKSYGWEVKSRVQSLNLLMKMLCQLNRSDLAAQVFQEMSYQGCYPDRESYWILMKGLCKEGMLNEAIHLLYSMFWRISQKGAGEDIVVYRTLLDALCDNGKIDEAVEILGKILKKGLKAPTRFYHSLDLSQCSREEHTESAKCLINEALVRGGTPSLASYNAMVIDLYSEDRISEANKMIEEMLVRGFWPTQLIYEAKVAALCRNACIEEAVTVVDKEMLKTQLVPTVRIYNILLKGLCDHGDSIMAMGYLKKMTKWVGCVPNEETYIILVSGLCISKRFPEASCVLEEMLIKSYRPNVETYNILVKGLCSIGRQYEAVMWVEEMMSRGIVPEFSVWNSLAASVCCDSVSETSEILDVITL